MRQELEDKIVYLSSLSLTGKILSKNEILTMVM